MDVVITVHVSDVDMAERNRGDSSIHQTITWWLLEVGQPKFDSIVLKATNTDDVDRIMEDADKNLMISRHLTERGKDFSISSAKSTQESIKSN